MLVRTLAPYLFCLAVAGFHPHPLSAPPRAPEPAQVLDSVLTPHRFFYRGIEPCAAQPVTPGQTAQFEDWLVAAATLEGEPLAELFERFLDQHLESPFAPAVHLGLGTYYAQSCRLQSAIDHFTAAWTRTQHLDTPAARGLADEALVQLGELLASLARLDDLDLLIQAAQHRPLDGGRLSARWLEVESFGRTLRSRPDAHPLCGSLALDALARALGQADLERDRLLSQTGHQSASSLAELDRLAHDAGLRTRPMQRLAPDPIPVPSLIHFQSGHFAAVLDHAHDLFAVADPALGQTLWLSGQQLNQEASGVFLVPQDFAHPDFAPLTPEQAARIQGRSVLVAWFRDREACPCDDCLCPGTGLGGGNGSGLPDPLPDPLPEADSNLRDLPRVLDGRLTGLPASNPFLNRTGHRHSQHSPGPRPASGMARWHVSQPELNLWLSDTPLIYHPARGPALILKLDYRQRNLETIPHLDTYGGTSFGVGWHASWIGWADYRTVYLPGGRQLDFTYPAGADLSHPDFEHHVRQRILRGPGGSVAGYLIQWPDGSSLEFAHPSNNPYAPFYLTAQVDPQGLRLQFAYQNHRLHSVTDADGAVTTLGYHAHDPWMVSWILAPGNRLVRFEPDPTTPAGYPARLRSITNAEELLSTIDYHPNGIPRALHTPYGTTGFAPHSALGGQNGWWLDRKLVVTQPSGATHLYAAALAPAPGLPDTFSSSQLPRNLPTTTLETGNRATRNTFHLGPLQVAATGGATDIENFTWGTDTHPGHLRKARIRHWLSRAHQAALWLRSLNHEQAPSPDGRTQGQITWFDYPGKSTSAKNLSGTHNLPSLVAQVRFDPAQPVYRHWTRNPLGHPLQETSPWSDPQGRWTTRTRAFTYDPQNQIDLLTATDWAGRVTHQYTYDTRHRLLRTRAHPEPGVTYQTLHTYDSQGRLSTRTTPSGLVQTRAYGTDGRLRSLSESAIGRSEQFTWREGHLHTHTDARGLRRTFTHDRLGRLTRIDYPDATYETFGYVGTLGPLSGRKHPALTEHRNRAGQLTRYEYDPQGRLIQIRDPLGRSTRLGYCACDAVSQQINPLGQITHYEHDLQGHLSAIVFPQPGGRQRLDFTRNPQGQILTQTDGDGVRHQFTYHPHGLLARVDTPGGLLSHTRYDIHDHPVQVTDPNGITVQQTFDALGRLRQRRYPDGAREQFEYSAAGLVATIDPAGQRTSQTHDPAGRPLSITNPNGHTTRLAYNPAGDVIELTDPLGRRTRWQYDLYGRWTQKIDPTDRLILTAQYDPLDRITRRWSRAKGTTTYTYDAVGNLTRIDYPTSPDVTFQYDPLDRLIAFSDPASGLTRHTYHPGGQLWTVDGPWDHDTLTYGYTPGGRRSTLHLQQPAGAWSQTYAHDPAGRLTRVQSPAGTFTYQYPAARSSTLWTGLRLPNQAVILRTHDTRGRLTRTELFNPAGQRLNAHAYGYDAGFSRLWMQRTDSSRVDYQYDPAGQLLAATGSGGQSAEAWRWQYDPAGNLTRRTQGAIQETFSVNARNELTATPQGNCTYDANGNLLQHIVDPLGPKLHLYTYDDENRLISAGTDTYHTAPNDRWRAEFVYDGLGRLRLRRDYLAPLGTWQLSGQTRYLYDQRLVLQERSEANLPLAAYTRGLDLGGSLETAGGIGGLLAQSAQYAISTGAWGRHDYPHADAGGNITFMLRYPESFSGSYRYEPFGQLTYADGRGSSHLLFSSKARLTPNELYAFGHRFYLPSLQRWLTPDPLAEAGGVNLYTFVHNNPVNRTDSFGLFGTGWNAYIRSQYACCNGQQYTLASQCCVDGNIVSKIPRHQKMGLSFAQCVGGETLLGGWWAWWGQLGGAGSGIAAAKWPALKACSAPGLVGCASAFLGGFTLGDQWQACVYCEELVCP